MDILKEREGIIVLTDYKRVIKRASNPLNIQGVQNAVRFYRALQDVPWVPRLYNYTDTTLEREYIEEDFTLDNTFHEEFRRNCIRIIFELKQRGIRHGDLVGHNFIVRGNYPVIFDWDQSNFVWERMPQKNPVTDARLLYSTIYYYTKDTYRVVRRWHTIRREIGHYKGWGRLVDLGTHQGDLVALAKSENFYATGVDSLRMRSTCLDEAREWWGKYDCEFVEANIVDFDCSPYDIATMLSTWAYIIKDKGKDVAIATLKRIIDQVDVLFFETQLYADGPGPEFLKTNDDVQAMLSPLASNVQLLETISGTQTRTMWKVSNK